MGEQLCDLLKEMRKLHCVGELTWKNSGESWKKTERNNRRKECKGTCTRTKSVGLRKLLAEWQDLLEIQGKDGHVVNDCAWKKTQENGFDMNA